MTASNKVMPQKVSRPSWLAMADPTAGGQRLRDSLQEVDDRYAQQVLCACVCACVCACMCVCVCTYVCVCVFFSISLCVSVFLCV